MSKTALVRDAAQEHDRNTTNPGSGRISVVADHVPLNTAPDDDRGQGEGLSPCLALGALKHSAAAQSAIRQQLARMLQSPVFVLSERLSRFLRFIVEHAIAGNQNYLKEYVIGSEVYDRKPPYHPSQDSIVRTEARRLRGKLKEYYENDGKDDAVYVYLRPGSYIPAFQSKEALSGDRSPRATQDTPMPAKTSAIAIAILPFSDLSESTLSSMYARGIPDELAFTLMQIEGCKVISPASMAHFNAQEHDVAAAMSKVGAQIAFEGSVREEGNDIRVTARIVNAAGFQLWATRFDAKSDAHTMFTIEEQIACALSAGLDALFGHSRPLRVV